MRESASEHIRYGVVKKCTMLHSTIRAKLFIMNVPLKANMNPTPKTMPGTVFVSMAKKSMSTPAQRGSAERTLASAAA